MNLSELLKKFYSLTVPYLFKTQKDAAFVLFSIVYTALKKNEEINSSTKIIVPKLITIETDKPDDFIMFFFNNNSVLKKLYKGELESKNLEKLRKDFKILYPLIELKEPFLCFILGEELKNGDLYDAYKKYKEKRKKIISGIKRIKISEFKEELFHIIKLIVESFAEEFYDKKEIRGFLFEKLS